MLRRVCEVKNMLKHKIKIIDAAMLIEPPLAACHWPKKSCKGFLKTFTITVHGHPVFVYCDVPWYLIPFCRWREYLPTFYVVVEEKGGVMTPYLQIIDDDRYTVDINMSHTGKYMYADYYYYHIC